jgi:DnaA regulatory inactivator Hda
VQRQLTLDLGTPPPSTFDNFHTGANAELVARLRGLDASLAAGPAVDPKADRTFYIWGEPGNGRSHLLHALAFETPRGHVRYIGPKSGLAAFTFDARVPIYAVDDCDSLSGAQQIALFNLFNEVRSHPNTALVATGNAPPMGLAVREDLRTRLGWGLVFHLAPLSDAGKAAVLKQAARERGINLADDVPAYLLTHFRRDMPSLMRLLDALDRFSLEQKRAVTLPLLRTMLATGEDDPDAATLDADASGVATLGVTTLGVTTPGVETLAAAATNEGADSRDEATSAAAHPAEAGWGHPADGHETSGSADMADAPAGSGEQSGVHGVELELFPSQETPQHAASTAADATPSTPAPGTSYEAPKPPALQPRAPVGAPPFQPPTDNVEGELGARFRDVVHRELGAELQGEVEADVSNEMSGELNGDLDPPAGSADPNASSASATTARPADPALPGAGHEDPSGGLTAAHPPASAPSPESSSEAPDAPQSDSGPPRQKREERQAHEEHPAPPERPASPAAAGTGNGFTRFK